MPRRILRQGEKVGMGKVYYFESFPFNLKKKYFYIEDKNILQTKCIFYKNIILFLLFKRCNECNGVIKVWGGGKDKVLCT